MSSTGGRGRALGLGPGLRTSRGGGRAAVAAPGARTGIACARATRNDCSDASRVELVHDQHARPREPLARPPPAPAPRRRRWRGSANRPSTLSRKRRSKPARARRRSRSSSASALPRRPAPGAPPGGRPPVRSATSVSRQGAREGRAGQVLRTGRGREARPRNRAASERGVPRVPGPETASEQRGLGQGAREVLELEGIDAGQGPAASRRGGAAAPRRAACEGARSTSGRCSIRATSYGREARRPSRCLPSGAAPRSVEAIHRRRTARRRACTEREDEPPQVAPRSAARAAERAGPTGETTSSVGRAWAQAASRSRFPARVRSRSRSSTRGSRANSRPEGQPGGAARSDVRRPRSGLRDGARSSSRTKATVSVGAVARGPAQHELLAVDLGQGRARGGSARMSRSRRQARAPAAPKEERPAPRARETGGESDEAVGGQDEGGHDDEHEIAREPEGRDRGEGRSTGPATRRTRREPRPPTLAHREADEPQDKREEDVARSRRRRATTRRGAGWSASRVARVGFPMLQPQPHGRGVAKKRRSGQAQGGRGQEQGARRRPSPARGREAAEPEEPEAASAPRAGRWPSSARRGPARGRAGRRCEPRAPRTARTDKSRARAAKAAMGGSVRARRS